MAQKHKLINASQKRCHNNFDKCGPQSLFTLGFGSKFVIKSSLKIPPHLNHVATLPCKSYSTFLAHSGQHPGVFYSTLYIVFTKMTRMHVVVCNSEYEHSSLVVVRYTAEKVHVLHSGNCKTTRSIIPCAVITTIKLTLLARLRLHTSGTQFPLISHLVVQYSPLNDTSKTHVFRQVLT